MRRIKAVRVSALGAILLGVLVAASPSAAREPQIAGYCWVTELTSRGTTLYQSSTFQKDSNYYDRDRWIADFKTHLREKGVNVNNYACRLWKGNAEALEDVRLAKEVKHDNLTTVVDVAWAPNDTFGGSTGRSAPSSSLVRRESRPIEKVSSAKSAAANLIPTSPKYVEVAGPNGTIRLSPEVAARNQAAADDYRRKMDEHARARAEHERKLALHQQSIAAAAAEKHTYEQKLALNEAQVVAHGAALEQHKAATKAPAKGAKGWMYCDARGAPGDKRRYYSRVAEVDYVPGQVTIIDVMGKNRPAFKSYVAGTHSIFFATDSLLHCPYSTTSLADAEALMARDKRGDGNNAIEIIQTGWMPAN